MWVLFTLQMNGTEAAIKSGGKITVTWKAVQTIQSFLLTSIVGLQSSVLQTITGSLSFHNITLEIIS